MQDSSDAGQYECRTGQMQYRSDAGQDRAVSTCQRQERTYAVKVRCRRTGQMHCRTDAVQDICSA